MKSERDPVSLDEFVFRRIHRSHFKGNLPVPVVRPAFQPNKHDTKGISMFREEFVSAPELANAGRKPGEYYIARLSVRELKDRLDLSVVPDVDESQPPGHALIPEINTSRMRDPRSKELQRELAKLASKSIVHEPEVEA